ncbi:CCL14 protein, partial [Ceuthmochares aereus]|nr:CCL14 protein [Ceuthmochares aereus]
TAYSKPIECCFKYAEKPIRSVQSFYETARECSSPAIVLVTPNGAKICANPKSSWVKKAIKKLQKKK